MTPRRRNILIASVVAGAALAVTVSLLPEQAGDAIYTGTIVAASLLLVAEWLHNRKRKAEPVDPQVKMAEALMQLSDNMRQVGEAVDGYRKDCEARGYSPTAAETMAMEFHAGLVRMIFPTP